MVLRLSLLGEREVHLNGKLLTNLSAEKAHALLYYLAVESDRVHRRDYLAEMFWPGNPPGYARNSLKQALSLLKKALGDRETAEPFLISSKRELQFNAGSSHWIDAIEVETHLNQTKTHDHKKLANCESCLESLNMVTKLYRDDFLSDFYLPDSPAFNEWVLAKREYYRQLMAAALNNLIRCYEDREEVQKAAAYAQDLVDLEPWNESSHRKLMSLLAACGKRSAALRQYQSCKSMLADEFGAEPSPETKALYEKIKAWQVNTNPSQEVSIHPMNATQPAEIPEIQESSHQSLAAWIKVSFLATFLVLVATIYLGFFHGNVNLAASDQAGDNITSIEEGSEGNYPDIVGEVSSNPPGKENPDAQPVAAYLNDPAQFCLEGEKLLYLEDFQDGQAQGWPEIEFRAQNWDIAEIPGRSGDLAAKNPGTISSLILYQEGNFSDAVFRADFLVNGHAQPNILWHSNNEAFQEERGLVTDSNYSIGFMDFGLHAERYTYPLPAVILGSGDYSVTPDVWHRIEISTYQGFLSVWVDGEEILAYQDPHPLPPGTIGLGLEKSLDQESMVYYDNLHVCELNQPFISVFDR